MNKRTLGEMFDHLITLSKTTDKVACLQAHDSVALRYLLALAHSNTTWLVPDGAPPFKQDKAPLGYSPSHLMREVRTLYLYLGGGGEDHLKSLRREQLFQQLLERLHEGEVQVLLAIKDKKFVSKYRCSKAVVDAAFPGLLSAPFDPRFIR